jgi:hypothetical protein
MEHIHTAIHAAADQNANGFRDAIGAALAAKIEDALELKKMQIASTFFANQEEESAEQETGSDEDV